MKKIFINKVLILITIINIVAAIIPMNKVDATSYSWTINKTMYDIGRNQTWYNGLEMVFYENDKVRIAEEQAVGKLVNYSSYIDTQGLSKLLDVPHTCTIRYTLLRGKGDRSVTGTITGNIQMYEGNYRMMIVGWGWLESSSDIRVDSITINTLNSSPTVPSSISVPISVKGGQNLNITWGSSTDADGDNLSYNLERSINGATYYQIYSGNSPSYTDSITKGWNTVAYRVRAYDGTDYSAYRTSSKISVINNEIPTITINEPISNKRIGNQDNLYINGSVKDTDVANILKVKYNLANINNREVTLTQPKSIVSNGQNQYFQGFINLNGLPTGKSILELYAEDNEGGTSNKVNVPINIFNSLESILKGLKSYTYNSGEPQIMVINTNTTITKSIENDKLIDQIKIELKNKNVRLYFIGQDGINRDYIESNLLR